MPGQAKDWLHADETGLTQPLECHDGLVISMSSSFGIPLLPRERIASFMPAASRTSPYSGERGGSDDVGP